LLPEYQENQGTKRQKVQLDKILLSGI